MSRCVRIICQDVSDVSGCRSTGMCQDVSGGSGRVRMCHVNQDVLICQDDESKWVKMCQDVSGCFGCVRMCQDVSGCIRVCQDTVCQDMSGCK